MDIPTRVIDIDNGSDTHDTPATIAIGDLYEVHEGLGHLRWKAATIRTATPADQRILDGLDRDLIAWRHFLGRVAAAAAGLALALMLAVALPGAAGTAQAATTAPPAAASSASLVDAPTYRVVLNRPVVRLRIPLVTSGPVDGGLGLRCAAVWGRTAYGVGLLGRSCGYTPLVTVRVRLDARWVPAGRSTIWLEDESDPGFLAPANLVALRPSQVTSVYAADDLAGRMFVAALVEHYQAAAGTWAPSKLSPLYVQVATRRGWRTRGTITTDVNGYASGHITTGAGTFLVRVVRPVGATVTSAVSTVQRVTVTDTAIDLV